MSESVTVYVVRSDDDNVCCPGTDIDSMWSTEESAASRVSILQSAGVRAHVEQCSVDPEIVGVP